MRLCPHCRQAAIGNTRKWLSSPAFPAKCRLCGGLSYVTASRSADLLLLATAWLIVTGLLAALLNSVWPLLIGGLAGLVAYLRYWQRAELIATDREATDQTQGRHAILNAIALFLTSLWS